MSRCKRPGTRGAKSPPVDMTISAWSVWWKHQSPLKTHFVKEKKKDLLLPTDISTAKSSGQPWISKIVEAGAFLWEIQR